MGGSGGADIGDQGVIKRELGLWCRDMFVIVRRDGGMVRNLGKGISF